MNNRLSKANNFDRCFIEHVCYERREGEEGRSGGLDAPDTVLNVINVWQSSCFRWYKLSTCTIIRFVAIYSSVNVFARRVSLLSQTVSSRTVHLGRLLYVQWYSMPSCFQDLVYRNHINDCVLTSV